MLVLTNGRSRRRGVNAGAVAQNVPGQQLIQARVKAPEAVVRLVQLAEQEGGAGAAIFTAAAQALASISASSATMPEAISASKAALSMAAATGA